MGVVNSEYLGTLSYSGSVKFVFTNWTAGFDLLMKAAAVILIFAVLRSCCPVYLERGFLFTERCD